MRYARNFPEGLLVLLTVAILIDLFAGTFSRYIFVRTFYWYEELGRILLLWITFIGAAVGIKRGSHFAVNLLFNKFPAKLRFGCSLFGLLFMAGIGVILVITGTSLSIDLINYKATSLKFSMGAVYICIPLGGLLMIVYVVPQLLRHIKNIHQLGTEKR